MKLVRCAEGHYYDADISSTCPHCRKNEASVQEDATSVLTEKSRAVGLCRTAVSYFGQTGRWTDFWYTGYRQTKK